MLRDWDCFTPRITNLCYAWSADGIGVAFFEDEKTWKIGSASLSEIRFPSRCEPVSSKIPHAVMRKTMHVGELWRKIENKEEAEAEGWDRDEVIKAIHTGGKASNIQDWNNWEKLLEDLKANEAHVSNTIEPIEILYGFIEEVDHAVSLYTCCVKGGGGFMQKRERVYKDMNEVFQVFPYGVGENNRLYTIRGMGYFIYDNANAENIMHSILLNASKVGALPQYQYTGTEALEDASFVDVGFAQMIPPGLALVDDGHKRDLRSTVVPAMQEIGNRLQTVSGGLTEAAIFGERENKDNIAATLDQLNKMNSFAISLFYPPLDRMFAEQVNRIFIKGHDTPETKEMKRVLIEEDGIPKEILKQIDWKRVKATRLLGGGSKANRINTFKDLREHLYGTMDAQGRKESDYDYALERGGKQYADRYIGDPQKTREPADRKLAELENNQMLEGAELEVYDGEDHLVHLEVHIEQLISTKDLVEQGGITLEDYTLRNLPIYEHSLQHLAMAPSNPLIDPVVNEARAQLQRLGEFFSNGIKALEKAQREQGEQPEVDPETAKAAKEDQMKTEAFLRDQQRKDAESQSSIDRKNAETQAKIAAGDAQTAANIRKG
jgi:hypothetical protein